MDSDRGQRKVNGIVKIAERPTKKKYKIFQNTVFGRISEMGKEY